jgi:hypothetical protein
MRACLLTLVLATCTGQPTVDAGRPPQPTPPPPEVEPWFVAADVALASRPASVEELQPWIAVDSLQPTDTLPGVVFASYGPSLPTATRPAIVWFDRASEARPNLIDLERVDDLTQARWVVVETSHDRRRIWLVADSAVEAPSWALTIVTSEDGGRSWRLRGHVRKPYYMAGVEGLQMDAAGRGALVVRWDDDPAAPISGTAPGRYTYRTSDFGATWSSPEFAPDDLAGRFAFDGDDVPPGTTVPAWFARRRGR